MKNLLLLFALLIFPIPVSAQVIPDYADSSSWKYVESDFHAFQPEDENYLAWSEGYKPSFMTDEPQYVRVVYKPVRRDIIEREGKDRLVSLSRNQPWLLIHIRENALNDNSVELLEYKDGEWVRILFEPLTVDELARFISRNYHLRMN